MRPTRGQRLARICTGVRAKKGVILLSTPTRAARRRSEEFRQRNTEAISKPLDQIDARVNAGGFHPRNVIAVHAAAFLEIVLAPTAGLPVFLYAQGQEFFAFHEAA